MNTAKPSPPLVSSFPNPTPSYGKQKSDRTLVLTQTDSARYLEEKEKGESSQELKAGDSTSLEERGWHAHISRPLSGRLAQKEGGYRRRRVLISLMGWHVSAGREREWW